MNFFKVLVTASAALALSATPALAGGNNGGSNNGGSGWGGFDLGQTLTITTVGQAGHAGSFGAAFDGTSGGAGAEKDGGSAILINQNFSTCSDANCAENGVNASLQAYEIGVTWAKAESNKAGKAAVAENFGVASAATTFGIGINACPGGCPAPSDTQGD